MSTIGPVNYGSRGVGSVENGWEINLERKTSGGDAHLLDHRLFPVSTIQPTF